MAMCNLRQALPIYLIFPPFYSSPFLACIAGVFCGPRALHNPAFASYSRHLGYENAQRAGASQNSQFIVVLLTRPVSEIFDLSLCFPFRRIKLGLKVEIISQFFSLYTSFTSYCVVVVETNNEDSMKLKAVDNAAAISPFPAFRIKF